MNNRIGMIAFRTGRTFVPTILGLNTSPLMKNEPQRKLRVPCRTTKKNERPSRSAHFISGFIRV